MELTGIYELKWAQSASNVHNNGVLILEEETPNIPPPCVKGTHSKHFLCM